MAGGSALPQATSLGAVRVEGNTRVDVGTILSYAGISAGEAVTPGQVNDAAQALRVAFAGIEVGDWVDPTSETRDVAVRLHPEDRVNTENIERLPIAVAHGEGRADFSRHGSPTDVVPAMRYLDGSGAPAETYPANHNGSPGGLTAVTTPDGRFTAMMPPLRGLLNSSSAVFFTVPIDVAMNT